MPQIPAIRNTTLEKRMRCVPSVVFASPILAAKRYHISFVVAVRKAADRWRTNGNRAFLDCSSPILLISIIDLSRVPGCPRCDHRGASGGCQRRSAQHPAYQTDHTGHAGSGDACLSQVDSGEPPADRPDPEFYGPAHQSWIAGAGLAA